MHEGIYIETTPRSAKVTGPQGSVEIVLFEEPMQLDQILWDLLYELRHSSEVREEIEAVGLDVEGVIEYLIPIACRHY